jgi:MFS family permease
VLTAYRRVLGLPGGFAMSATGVLARLPISMMTLGIVVAVSAVYDSYGLAGQVSAAYIVGNAALAIVQGRLTDRFGQAAVLVVDAALFGLFTGLLVHAVTGHASSPWPHLWAGLAGAVFPQVGSMVRARWAHLADEGADRHTAFAVESVGDEVVFVTGPALVTFVSTAWASQTGLLVALVIGTLGPMTLAVQRRTEPPSVAASLDGVRPPLPWATMAPLTLAACAMGSLFGAMEVATVAFATDEGHRAVSGALLAILSLGSLIAGVLAGAHAFAASLAARIRIGMTALTAGFVLLPFVGVLWLLGLLMFLAGFAIAPTLIAVFSLVEQSTPRGRLTEAMAWVSTGMAAGIAPGAWLGGVVADHSGGAAAYWVCVVSGAVAAAAAWTTPDSPPRLASAP